MKKLIIEIRKIISAVYILQLLKVLPDESDYKIRFAEFNKKNIDSL